MQRIAVALAAWTLLTTTGCATRPTIVESKPLWPFEQLQIRTSIGTVVGYLSRPNMAPARLIVVVQRSPCGIDHRDEYVSLGTSGLLWQQFKDDSLFFQFERPGTAFVAADASCTESLSDAGKNWHRAIDDSVQALRSAERLHDEPTIYIGIGAGFQTALLAALSDEHAASVAIVSGTYQKESPAAIASMQRRTNSNKPSVVIVHAMDDSRAPLAFARQLLERVTAARLSASMLVIEHSDFDFRIATTDSDCFEAVAKEVGDRVRNTSPAPGVTTLGCEEMPQPQSDPEVQIERVQKHSAH